MNTSDTFLAKVECQGKEPRFISNCTIYKNKLVQSYKRGVGKSHTVGGMFNGEGDVWEEFDSYEDAYRPFINSTLIESSGLTKSEISRILEADPMNAFKDERIMNCMFTLGENPNGYKVTNQTAIQEQEKAIQKAAEEQAFADKTVVINFADGVFGFVITQQLPKSVWSLVKHHATYHNGDEMDEETADDMGFSFSKNDLKGWFYTERAIVTLLNFDYKVSYKGVILTCLDNIKDINKEIKEEERNALIASTNYYEESKRLSIKLRNLFEDAEYMTSEQCKEIEELPEILFEAINIQGADIYGGGRWLHKDKNYLYLIQNNGMDGDDWSRNNYTTGGAGAIAHRIILTREVVNLINELNDFENKTVGDYLK